MLQHGTFDGNGSQNNKITAIYAAATLNVPLILFSMYTGCPKKVYLTLKLYFEAVTIMMLGISGFPASLDLYNSFDTLLVCLHDLMNKWQ